jgi:type II secretory pathway component GspD/PulD (secretin)
MTHSHLRIATLVVIGALLAGCGASRAYGRGESAARAGNWDVAVEQYRQALQADPDNLEYRLALERAMLSASVAHLDQARLFEARGQLGDALREYRRASEYDPPNRQVAAKAAEIERRLRDESEANRPRPLAPPRPGTAPAPLANLNVTVPTLRFPQASLRDVLNTLGEAGGIDVTYERDFQDRTVTVNLQMTTLGEALQQVLSANQFFYKVVNQRTILVIPDNQTKRSQYDEQVVQTFYLSHSDSAEISAFVNNILRIPGAQQSQAPTVYPNKTNNSITARASASMMPLVQRLVEMQDTPRAEILVDVQIMEVSKSRTKDFGLNLSDYAIQGVFSPEVDPRGADGSLTSPAFNANTVSRGISASDFYLAVPSAVVRFLETDQRTKVMAKPQLRGAEGSQLKFQLGEEIPVLSTAFTPIAGGGSNVNPLTSYNYRQVGIILEMTPRVTYENEVILDLYLENSALGPPVDVAGQSIPRFTSRKVQTKLRLREGESTLLAGLLADDERTGAAGFPGLLNIPVIRQLFAANKNTAQQTDIVMLLTPRIVRTHELTPDDVAPLFIGTQNNLGITGPPPLIAVAPEPAAAGAQAGVIPAPPQPEVGPAVPVGGVPTGVGVLPPGSSTVPGTTNLTAAAVANQRAASGQIVVSPPSGEFRMGGGPYNVPISITGASQISNVAVTVTYNPAVLRLRATAEGSFMRAGGVSAAFTQSGDTNTGRVDIAIVRAGDMTGVAGTGLLAALLFEPVGAGQANLSVTATATAPGGTPVPLQFAPIPPVTVR